MKKKKESGPEPDFTELSQRHESDLTDKEKRLLERHKLKEMTWKERIEYIWAYYKPVLAAICGVIVAICFGVEIYQNKQKVELLSVAVADCTMDADTAKDNMEADLLGFLGTGDRHETITLDTNVMSGEDYTSVIKRSVVVATGTTDVLVCGSDLYETYGEQEAFLSAEELLGDDYSDYEAYLTNGRIDLSKSKKWESYGITDYEPVYVGVLVTSENTENAKRFVEYFFSDNT